MGASSLPAALSAVARVGKSLLHTRPWPSRRAPRRRHEPAILYNVNGADECRYGGRALVVYRIRSFLLREDDPAYLAHHSLRRCKLIATLLGELGYIVDVASGDAVTRRDITALEFAPAYDLVISDRVDMKDLGRSFRPDCVKVFLARMIDHATVNRNLTARYRALERRRSCRVSRRGAQPTHMPWVRSCDAIFAVGNAAAADTWRRVFAGPIYPFNNCGYVETRFRFEAKDWNDARKHFLFFASRPQVRKGLDLLLEIFPKYPDLHLYVCSLFEREEDFRACYERELFGTPNVHPVGWVQVNSPRFYDLVDRCAYVVHPACAEGQPGSVVQCMYAGLIPLVTREVGIDTEDFGVLLEDGSVAEVERVILELSRVSPDWHRQRSLRTRAVAEARYSEAALAGRWREMLREVVGPARPSVPGESAAVAVATHRPTVLPLAEDTR